MKKLLAAVFTILTCITVSYAKTHVDSDASGYTKVHAAHILVANKSQAQALKNRIKGGETFGSVAKKYSACPSGAYGGDLGYFERGKMVKEFENAAFNLPAGEISDPIETEFGWHIIKVIDKE